MDTQLNQLGLSDFKLGAFLCIFIGYIFLILPENLYSDCKAKYFPDSHEEIETHSLTRRYKYASPTSPSPILNSIKKVPSKPLINNVLTTKPI